MAKLIKIHLPLKNMCKVQDLNKHCVNRLCKIRKSHPVPRYGGNRNLFLNLEPSWRKHEISDSVSRDFFLFVQTGIASGGEKSVFDCVRNQPKITLLSDKKENLIRNLSILVGFSFSSPVPSFPPLSDPLGLSKKRRKNISWASHV